MLHFIFLLLLLSMCMGVVNLQLSRFLCEKCGRMKCTVCPSIINDTDTDLINPTIQSKGVC